MGPFRGERTLIPSKIALSYVNYFWYLLILWNCVFIDFHWCWLYLNIYIYYISYQIHPKPFSSFPNTGLKPAVRAVVSTKANTTPSEPPSGVVATEPVLRKTWKTQSWTSSERIWWLSYHCLIIVLSVNLCQLMSLFSLVLWDTDVYWCILWLWLVMVSYGLLHSASCWILLTPQSPPHLFQEMGPGLVSTAGLRTAKVQVVAQVLQQIAEVYRSKTSLPETNPVITEP